MNILSDVRSRAILFPVLFILFIYSGNALATAHKLNIVPIIVSSLLSGDRTIFYRDSDDDGFGNPALAQLAETQPAGYVSNNNDCDDSNPDIKPGALEVEDSIDNDCDQGIDEGLGIGSTYYEDADLDGYGNAASTWDATTQPAGYVSDNSDRDDTDLSINPGAIETADGEDNNCDGQVDEGLGTTYYLDADADTYGDPDVSKVALTQPAGYVSNDSDCDDTDSGTYPGATEIADDIDNNCDGQVDEGLGATYYRDFDADTYGDPTASLVSLIQPDGYVSDNFDCDDTDSGIHPGATEIADGKDNNCDGQVDEGLGTTYYRDADADTYGDPDVLQVATTRPSGYVENSADCDDSNASINPGATEADDGVDNNCDGQIDEGFYNTVFYWDADRDGYGDPLLSWFANTQPAGYVSQGNDCDDSDSAINPDATEIIDGKDNDCDGSID